MSLELKWLWTDFSVGNSFVRCPLSWESHNPPHFLCVFYKTSSWQVVSVHGKRSSSAAEACGSLSQSSLSAHADTRTFLPNQDINQADLSTKYPLSGPDGSPGPSRVPPRATNTRTVLALSAKPVSLVPSREYCWRARNDRSPG